MPKSMTQQIKELREANRKEKIANFKEWLNTKLGREVKAGDTIVLDQKQLFGRGAIPMRVIKVQWGWSHPELFVECAKKVDGGVEFYKFGKDDIDYDNIQATTLTKGDLKKARFATKEELDGSGLQFQVKFHAYGRYNNNKRDFGGKEDEVFLFDTLKEAHSKIRSIKRAWKGDSHTFSPKKAQIYSYITLYPGAKYHKTGSIQMTVVPKQSKQ